MHIPYPSMARYGIFASKECRLKGLLFDLNSLVIGRAQALSGAIRTQHRVALSRTRLSGVPDVREHNQEVLHNAISQEEAYGQGHGETAG